MNLERIRDPQKLPNHLSEADGCDVSFVVGFDGWVEDLVRFHSSLVAHCSGNWELVVVDNPVNAEASLEIHDLAHVNHLPLKQSVGWAAARNLGLRSATGSLVVLADTSIELDADPIPALTSILSDESIGLLGRWGVCTLDGFEFSECDGPDVHGVEAYLMAMRRSALSKTGLLDSKFRWYRNADLDFSFQVRNAGLRTVVNLTLPVVRHTHRQWEAASNDERQTMSQRNFGRFRMHWGDRADLLRLPQD